MNKQKESTNIKSFALLYFSFFIYSLTSFFSKQAALTQMFSLKYFVLMFAVFFIFAVYAILWQQVLKQLPLSVAMANKPVVIILVALYSVVFFGEKLSISFLIGLTLIFTGIVIINKE